MRKAFLFLGIILIAMLLAACGGSDDAMRGSAEAGKVLFNQAMIAENAGCVTCHSLEPEVVIVGPSLAHIADEAAEEGEDLGMSAEEFLRQSILEPNAVIATDFPADAMPQNWGDVLSEQQVDDLVAFLMTLEE